MTSHIYFLGVGKGGGIASPGAAVADDGTVIVGYSAEASPSGGANRGIGIAAAAHPLGPFTKRVTPLASPTGVCGGAGRCDDVIMQSWPGDASKHGEMHIYHSVKGSSNALDNGIRHRASSDGGKTWGTSTLVLTTGLQPGTDPAESIAGKYFPNLLGAGKDAMVIITDGGVGTSPLHAYVSASPGNMTGFVAAAEPTLTPSELPPGPPSTSAAVGSAAPANTLRSDAGLIEPTSIPPKHPPHKGAWAMNQIAFIPGGDGTVAMVSYAIYTGEPVWAKRHQQYSMAYTHTIYNFTMGD